MQLEKSYGETTALMPLDLRVRPAEAVVLIGHNGSGKTTLLRMLAGLLEPSSGEAEVSGHPVGSLGARAATSFLSDTPTFYDDLSVWEHLEYTARLHGVEDWEQRAADLLGHVGLYDRADDLPTRFSRGLRQKAAITLALVRPFDVLLVDEPFVGLDATGKADRWRSRGHPRIEGAKPPRPRQDRRKASTRCQGRTCGCPGGGSGEVTQTCRCHLPRIVDSPIFVPDRGR
jgi:ABC-type multidrug transport system ATPase subunit